jgi:AcrR family transcriptional regulator
MGRPREISDLQIAAAARRCFIERGAGVSAAEIARELGLSHTTLFNRFGSKEGLMLAALGPPAEVPWIAALEVGPDERPLRDQLVEHARVMSAFFQDLQVGHTILLAAGVDPARARAEGRCDSAPERAWAALVGWITRAQDQGRIAPCEPDTLAAFLLGALHSQSLTSGLCGRPRRSPSSSQYVEDLIDLLWQGLSPRSGGPGGVAAALTEPSG